MKVSVEAANGEKYTYEMPDEKLSDIKRLAGEAVHYSKLESYIDSLSISADLKVILSKIASVTVRVGSIIVKAGKKIIELACFIVQKYKNATFGMIFGLLLGAVASSIPILGVVLGAFVTPVFTIVGGVVGYADDLRDESLRRTIKEAAATFSPLNGAQYVAG